MPTLLEDVFSFYFLNKTDLSKNYTHGRTESCSALRALTSIASNLGCDETEPRRLHSPDRWMVTSVRGRDAGVQHPTLTDPLGESRLSAQPRVPVCKADSSVSLKFFEVSGIFQVSFFFV